MPRKRWIAHGLVPAGKLYLDAGAVQAIRKAGKSLLAAGIVAIEGGFESQDAVVLCDRAGEEIARGLVNYSSAELRKIQGCQSDAIAEILGHPGADTVVHRDNLALLELLGLGREMRSGKWAWERRGKNESQLNLTSSQKNPQLPNSVPPSPAAP